MRVLFRVAAGPRMGYGHLVRSRSLARWLGVPWVVSLRGDREAGTVAAALGARVTVRSLAYTITTRRWDGLVLDDPLQATADRAVALARRVDLKVASLHDLRLAPVPSDLAVDGSLPKGSTLPARRVLAGPQFMVLDPALKAVRALRPNPSRVVISLGGGRNVRAALLVARALSARHRNVEIVVTSPIAHSTPECPRVPDGTASLAATGPMFRRLLASAAVAVTGGGVTLYEAASLGVPVVPVAVVFAQEPTVRAFLDRRIVVSSAVHVRNQVGWAQRVASDVCRALDQGQRTQEVARQARRVIDGEGGARVAFALRHLFGHSTQDRS